MVVTSRRVFRQSSGNCVELLVTRQEIEDSFFQVYLHQILDVKEIADLK